jgi:ketosteroid isomerase-like protein
MSASVELVRIAVEAHAEGDTDIALALADPGVRWDERHSRPDGQLVTGRDAVEAAMRGYREAWREYAFELEDVAEVKPGSVAGICRERGIDAAGAPVDRRFGALWIVEDGRIASWATYATPREAVRAAKRRGRAAQPFGGERPAPRQPASISVLKPPVSVSADERRRRAAKARARLQRRRLAS